jgi:hypothetical protein
MALYHLTVKPVSRKAGRSATAAIAYRTADRIHDLTTDEVFDYTRKRGVEHTEIVLPTEAARQDINWARDRQALWNAAEMAENRSNSRVAREYEIALPHELNRGQRIELVRAFAKDLADRYGVGVDFAIHAPHRSGDERNHHAHILTTTRRIEAGGLGEKAEIEWSDGNRRKAGLGAAKEEITLIRARWETLHNEHLLSHGISVRIDHRSLEAQGIHRTPTSHLGPAVSAMERRGMETEVCRRIEWQMQEAVQLRLEQAAELGRIEREMRHTSKQLLVLDADIEAAQRVRQTPALYLEQIKAQGRADWLALRKQAQEEAAAARTLERSNELTRDLAAATSSPKQGAPEKFDLEQIKAQGRAGLQSLKQEMQAEQLRAAQEREQQRERERGRGRSLGRHLGDDDGPRRGPEDDGDGPRRGRGRGRGGMER